MLKSHSNTGEPDATRAAPGTGGGRLAGCRGLPTLSSANGSAALHPLRLTSLQSARGTPFPAWR